MTRYEYRIEKVEQDKADLLTALNDFGAKGWQYMGIHDGDMVLMRAIPVIEAKQWVLNFGTPNEHATYIIKGSGWLEGKPDLLARDGELLELADQ